MAQQDVHFNPEMGPLKAEVQSGSAQQGAYSLTLSQGAIDRAIWKGTFKDPTDDEYTLPDAAAHQDGRTLYCNAKVVLESPIANYAVTMTVKQDGSVIGTVAEADSGNPGSVQSVDLFAYLKSSG